MISISFSWSTICYGSNMEQFRSPNFPVITVLSIAIPCVPVSPDPALVVKPHWDPRQLPLTFGIPQVIEVLVGMIFLGSFSPCIFLGDSWEKHLKRLDGIFGVMFRSTEIWRKTTGDSKYFDGILQNEELHPLRWSLVQGDMNLLSRWSRLDHDFFPIWKCTAMRFVLYRKLSSMVHGHVSEGKKILGSTERPHITTTATVLGGHLLWRGWNLWPLLFVDYEIAPLESIACF